MQCNLDEFIFYIKEIKLMKRYRDTSTIKNKDNV